MAQQTARDAATPGRTPLPSTMRAVVLRKFGDLDVLREENVPTPQAAAGEAVVQVAAVEVSRNRDVATRTGNHPFSRSVVLPHVLGGDFAGIVAAAGDGVDAALVGRRVAVMNHYTCGTCPACRAGHPNECSNLAMVGIHRWGSYAEYTSVPAGNLHLLPDDIDLAQAAALAATGPVGLTQLRTAQVSPATVVVVPGMTGALASTLAALADVLGATVIGLSGRSDQVVTRPGLTVLHSSHPDLTDAILTAAAGTAPGGRPQVVIDNVCAPEVFAKYFAALANGARVVVSGAIAMPELPTLPVPARDLYSRSISLLGVRSHTDAVTEEFWQLVDDGFRLPPGLLHEYALASVSDAHRAISDGSAIGHTILRVSDIGQAGSK